MSTEPETGWLRSLLAATQVPSIVETLERDTEALGFDMASDRETGALLRFVASRCEDGRVLELGTGTGLSAAWMLDGLNRSGRLRTVDNDPIVSGVAQRRLGHDDRVDFVVADGAEEIVKLRDRGERFDLVFADAWPGKYSHLDEGLGLLADGGVYVVDDLMPQPNWPEGHDAEVVRLFGELDRADLRCTPLTGATGMLLVERLQ